MKKLLVAIIMLSGLIFAIVNTSYCTPCYTTCTTTVVEEITGTSGDWTYTYTIINNGDAPIWNWAVWFPTNPEADLITAGDVNWGVTDLDYQGFFPEEYTAFWGTAVYVYDGAGDPLDDDTSDETLLVGPNWEPGFYSTYAGDFLSSKPGQYWDGDSWKGLPDPLSLPYNSPIWDYIWRGDYWGWLGIGADIQTAPADPIPVGSTGCFSIHSSTLLVEGRKSFSFSTLDYWYSAADWYNNILYYDFEGSGGVCKLIEIDIKPGSYPNNIKLKSREKLWVAVLTTDDFNAGNIDPGTVSFAGAEPRRCKLKDVDHDGDWDMQLQFKTKHLNLTEDSTEACLTGETYDGTYIWGRDTVNIVPKKKKKGKDKNKDKDKDK